MNFSDYEMTIPYPDYKNYSVEEVITRGGKVVSKKMVNDKDAFYQAKKEYRQKQNELDKQFEEDLYLELGIVNHPKRELLFQIAWDNSRSEGLSAVFYFADELVELMR